jgi:hypothetical protein
MSRPNADRSGLLQWPDSASDVSGAGYQACVARQCGQATVVETGARKTKPQWQA